MVRKTTITTTTTITKRHHEGHVPLFVDDQGRPLTDDRSARTSAGIVSGMREGRIDDDDDDGGGGGGGGNQSPLPRPSNPVPRGQGKKEESLSRLIPPCLPSCPLHQHK